LYNGIFLKQKRNPTTKPENGTQPIDETTIIEVRNKDNKIRKDH
jgi:hypothetical protein